MALITTIDELKTHAPVLASFDIELILPDIERAEQRWIIPVLGQAFYDEIFSAYDGDTLTTLQEDVLNKIRKPLAQFACVLYAPKGNVSFGSQGIQQVHSENGSKPAFQWSVDQMLMSYLEGGYEGLDILAAFLEANKDDLTTWATSAEYEKSKELFLNTSLEFDAHFSINRSRKTFEALRHILKRHNDITVKNLLGSDLYDELKEQVIDDDVTADNELLLNFIRPALVHLTVADAVTELAVKIDEFGITVVTSNTSSTTQNQQARQAAPSHMLNDLARKEKAIGEQYLAQLTDFLSTNSADYPLYTVPDEDDLEPNNDSESTVFII